MNLHACLVQDDR